MPLKFNLPYEGPPSWLDASAERSLEASPTYTKVTFILEGMRVLLRIMLPRQAANVLANAVNESGWGRSCYWNNAGGWKITKPYAQSYPHAHGGVPAPWWKGRGNVDSGDAPWCFYRCFDSLEEFLTQWCANFIPKESAAATSNARYRTTGRRFWIGDDAWFGEMILAGYKGRPSQIRMAALRAVGADDARHPSVTAHRRIVEEVLVIWAQSALHLDPDGAWGPKSRAACSAFQKKCRLLENGTLTGDTLAALARSLA
jgi:hypothetical protein